MKRELARMARPTGSFDARRYFRGPADLRFYNVGMHGIRELGRAIHLAYRDEWSMNDVMAFADLLMRDRYLESKAVAIDVVARRRRAFSPAWLPRWKRWLASGLSANWATTDSICGYLIGPLLVQHPELAERVARWTSARSLWVRRASAVALVGLARRGLSLDLVYGVATRLRGDHEDLIHKAVGWLLREAGRADASRLEQYLRRAGPATPRTTLRYAIERFPPAARRALLTETRGIFGIQPPGVSPSRD